MELLNYIRSEERLNALQRAFKRLKPLIPKGNAIILQKKLEKQEEYLRHLLQIQGSLGNYLILLNIHFLIMILTQNNFVLKFLHNETPFRYIVYNTLWLNQNLLQIPQL